MKSFLFILMMSVSVSAFSASIVPREYSSQNVQKNDRIPASESLGHVAIECINFYAYNQADGDAFKSKNGHLLLGSKIFNITAIDMTSEKTKMLYNGDFIKKSWPVTIIEAESENGNIIKIRYFPESGSKNSTEGKVEVSLNGKEVTLEGCRDNTDY